MGDRRDDLHNTWLLKKGAGRKPESGAEDGDAEKEPAPAAEQAEAALEQAEQTAQADVARQRAEREGEDRPRVLAYTDSDSDVESHIKRVKDQLLGGDKEAKAAEAAEQAAEAEAAATAAEAAAALEERRLEQRKASSLGRAVGGLAGAAGGVAAAVGRQITAGVLLRAVALLVVHKINSRAGDAVDAAAVAAAVVGVVASRLHSSGDGGRPSAVQGARDQALDMGRAALLVMAGQLAHRLRQRMLRSRCQRLPSRVDVEALTEAAPVEPEKQPETAAEFAAVYRAEMSEMRRMLAACEVALPEPRFDPANAELMRFALACGLLAAQTPAERAAAVETAVRRVIDTVEWVHPQRLLPEKQLRRWERLVAWRGADGAGRPILLIRLGRALQLCSTPEKLDDFAVAICSQIAAGVAERLSSAQGDGPEHIVAVVDCRETCNWETLSRSRQVLAIIRQMAADLSAHYPCRLHRLHLLELPLLARVGLQAGMAHLAEATKEKIVNCSTDDASLPITVALLQRRRSRARGLMRSASFNSLATSDECSTPRRAESPLPSSATQSPPAAARASADDQEGEREEGTGQQQGNGEEGGGSAQKADAAEAEPLPPPPPAVQQESPLTADVATNLLPALDAADDGAISSAPPLPAQAPVGAAPHVFTAAAAPASHALSTPPGLSPQHTPDEHEMFAAAGAAAAASDEAQPAGCSTSAGSASATGEAASPRSPWNGLAAMLTGMLPAAGSADAGASNGSQALSVRAHRLALSRESSYGTPRAPGSGQSKKGGLTDLPSRPSTAKKTPAKSSLRRTQSQETPQLLRAPLGSFPLRRQSSVSWAEDLERVREIVATPPGSKPPSSDGWQAGQPPGPRRALSPALEEGEEAGPATAAALPTAAAAAAAMLLAPFSGGGGAEAETGEQLSLPLVMVLLLCAGVLQRVLLGV